MEYFLFFLAGVIITVAVYETIRKSAIAAIMLGYKQMEVQYLIAGLSLMQYKHHAAKIVEIAYLGEPDRKYECKRVIERINEKFDEYSEAWVSDLITKLPYKTQYNDWKSALVYAEQLIKDNNK